MSRCYNLRRIKSQCSYTARELKDLLSINIATIRRWVKQGLRPIDQGVPQLFLGSHVIAFLRSRTVQAAPLEAGEFYCLSCKSPRLPRHRIVSLIPRSPTTVDFAGPCGACGTGMFRRVRLSEILAKLGECTVASKDDQMTMSGREDSPPMLSHEEMAA